MVSQLVGQNLEETSPETLMGKVVLMMQEWITSRGADRVENTCRHLVADLVVASKATTSHATPLFSLSALMDKRQPTEIPPSHLQVVLPETSPKGYVSQGHGGPDDGPSDSSDSELGRDLRKGGRRGKHRRQKNSKRPRRREKKD